MARIAKSLGVLRDQINKMAPARRKTSDGWLGDPAHAARVSDHNPDSIGIVRALDITHDPAHGVDAGAIADQLRRSKDQRIKYVISNRRIASPPGWAWRSYSGSNPHTMHFHLSVVKAAIADTVRPWAIGSGAMPAGEQVFSRPILRRGSTRVADVKVLQRLLKITANGVFDKATEDAVKAFQVKKKLVVDGIVGVYSWQALGV